MKYAIICGGVLCPLSDKFTIIREDTRETVLDLGNSAIYNTYAWVEPDGKIYKESYSEHLGSKEIYYELINKNKEHIATFEDCLLFDYATL